MRYLLLVVGLMTVGANAYASKPFNPEGLWLTENERSAIRVEKCGEELCGHVEWIIDGGMQFDQKNPKEALRGQPMCGLQIMQGLQQNPSNPNEWEGGNIYKADDGDVYSAELEITAVDKMEVTGYIGFSFIGKSQVWTRVSADNYRKCKPAKK